MFLRGHQHVLVLNLCTAAYSCSESVYCNMFLFWIRVLQHFPALNLCFAAYSSSESVYSSIFLFWICVQKHIPVLNLCSPTYSCSEYVYYNIFLFCICVPQHILVLNMCTTTYSCSESENNMLWTLSKNKTRLARAQHWISLKVSTYIISKFKIQKDTFFNVVFNTKPPPSPVPVKISYFLLQRNFTLQTDTPEQTLIY